MIFKGMALNDTRDIRVNSCSLHNENIIMTTFS